MLTTTEILGTIIANNYFVNEATEYGCLFLVSAANRPAVIETSWSTVLDAMRGEDEGVIEAEKLRHAEKLAATPIADYIDYKVGSNSYYDDNEDKTEAIIDVLAELVGWDDNFDAFVHLVTNQ